MGRGGGGGDVVYDGALLLVVLFLAGALVGVCRFSYFESNQR